MAQPHICFILHGRRSPSHWPDRLLRQFSRRFVVQIHITTSGLRAEEVACLAVTQGCDFVIAVGGDGTVHEVVNGVMRAPAERRARVTLGVLPVGTGNDFARSLGMSASVSRLYRLIQRDSARWLDLGRIDTLGEAPWTRYFANIASLGVSSAVVERVARMPRWLPAGPAYGLGAVLSLLTWRPSRMQVTFDEGTVIEEPMVDLCLANGRYFGGGLGVAPEARQDDGLLDVVMIRNASVVAFLRFMPLMRQTRRIDDARVRYAKSRGVRVSSDPPGCPLEADGEQLGSAPVRVSVLPGALRWLGCESGR
ncbi:MAG: diacylglycerol kinase family lipid kinase [Paludibacterium sp.]|uniref:diacylglycerol/lipid kinase family protein n=1 Tax=Paludibacterium sp. TaxID=1917523 RepID=UPI0025F29FD9|nr:diacylglycerol kinase family protein [Paludibacterium sp.]MBV8045760.1 diacylglycerol kinase family lipid kinase [Paludibacterium sp.]MBV8648507.1 diacylglycerol kinase family lipid kinase [Paludibacterium sp.]